MSAWLIGWDSRQRRRIRETKIFAALQLREQQHWELLSHKKSSHARQLIACHKSISISSGGSDSYHVCSNFLRCISIQVKLESYHFMIMSFQLTLNHLITGVTHLQWEWTQLLHTSNMTLYWNTECVSYLNYSYLVYPHWACWASVCWSSLAENECAWTYGGVCELSPRLYLHATPRNHHSSPSLMWRRSWHWFGWGKVSLNVSVCVTFTYAQCLKKGNIYTYHNLFAKIIWAQKLDKGRG